MRNEIHDALANVRAHSGSRRTSSVSQFIRLALLCILFVSQIYVANDFEMEKKAEKPLTIDKLSEASNRARAKESKLVSCSLELPTTTTMTTMKTTSREVYL